MYLEEKRMLFDRMKMLRLAVEQKIEDFRYPYSVSEIMQAVGESREDGEELDYSLSIDSDGEETTDIMLTTVMKERIYVMVIRKITGQVYYSVEVSENGNFCYQKDFDEN